MNYISKILSITLFFCSLNLLSSSKYKPGTDPVLCEYLEKHQNDPSLKGRVPDDAYEELCAIPKEDQKEKPVATATQAPIENIGDAMHRLNPIADQPDNNTNSETPEAPDQKEKPGFWQKVRNYVKKGVGLPDETLPREQAADHEHIAKVHREYDAKEERAAKMANMVNWSNPTEVESFREVAHKYIDVEDLPEQLEDSEDDAAYQAWREMKLCQRELNFARGKVSNETYDSMINRVAKATDRYYELIRLDSPSVNPVKPSSTQTYKKQQATSSTHRVDRNAADAATAKLNRDSAMQQGFVQHVFDLNSGKSDKFSGSMSDFLDTDNSSKQTPSQKVDRNAADAATAKLNRSAAPTSKSAEEIAANLRKATENLNSHMNQSPQERRRYAVPLSSTRKQSRYTDFADQKTAEVVDSLLEGFDFASEGLEALGYGREAKIASQIGDNIAKAVSNLEKIGNQLNNGVEASSQALTTGAGGAATAYAIAQPWVGVVMAGAAIMNGLMALDSDAAEEADKVMQERFQQVLMAIQEAVTIITSQISRFEKNTMTRFDKLEHFMQKHHKIMAQALMEIKWDTGDIKSELRMFKQKTENAQLAMIGQLSNVHEAITGVHRLIRNGFSNNIILNIQDLLRRSKSAQFSKSLDGNRLNKYKLLLADAAADTAQNHALTCSDTNIDNNSLILRDLQGTPDAGLVVNLLRNYVKKNYVFPASQNSLVNPTVWQDCVDQYCDILASQLMEPDYPDAEDSSRDRAQLERLIQEGQAVINFVEAVNNNHVLKHICRDYQNSLQELAKLIENEYEELRTVHTRVIRDELLRLHEKEKALIDNIITVKFPEYTRQINFANEARNRVQKFKGRVQNVALAMIRYHGEGPGGIGYHNFDGNASWVSAKLPPEIEAFAFGGDEKRIIAKKEEQERIAKQLKREFLDKRLKNRLKGLSELTKDQLFVYQDDNTVVANTEELVSNRGISTTWVAQPKNPEKNKLMFTLPSLAINNSAWNAAFLNVGNLHAEYEVKDNNFYLYIMHRETNADKQTSQSLISTYKMPFDQPNDTDEDIWHFLYGGTYARPNEDVASYDLFVHKMDPDEIDYEDEQAVAAAPLRVRGGEPKTKNDFLTNCEFRTTHLRHMPWAPPRDDTTLHTIDLYPSCTFRKGHVDEIKDHMVTPTSEVVKTSEYITSIVKKQMQLLHGDWHKKVAGMLDESSDSKIANIAKRATVQYKTMQLLAKMLYGEKKVASHNLLKQLCAKSSQVDLAQARTIEDMRLALLAMAEKGIVRKSAAQNFKPVTTAFTEYTQEKTDFGAPEMTQLSDQLERLKTLLRGYPAAKEMVSKMRALTSQENVELLERHSRAIQDLQEGQDLLRTDVATMRGEVSAGFEQIKALLSAFGKKD